MRSARRGTLRRRVAQRARLPGAAREPRARVTDPDHPRSGRRWARASRPVLRDHERSTAMFRFLIASAVVFLIATFPASWLLMLFLGNVHVNVSYWGALPLGVIVSVLIGAAASQSDY